MAAYTTIDNPELYFQTVLWTGNATDRSITLGGDEDMQPDYVWIKNRGSAESHRNWDSVRGANKQLSANNTNAESTATEGLTAFDSDGFTIGTDSTVNENTKAIVAWCWKAGTSFSNDASATSVGSVDSTGSINTDAGISIMSWTHDGSNGTIGHGLGTAPQVVITKERNSTGSWNTFHVGSGNGNRLVLQGTNANISTTLWNSTSPTSSVFSFNDGLTSTMIAYCFADVQGYSKFGSYTGNGNVDGTFIYTGFRPAYFMTRRTDSANSWNIFDNKRDPHNEVVIHILADDSAGDETGTADSDVDFLSNGVKIREDNNGVNASGGTYIYMAFAEAPFVNSNGVPCNAR
jgi:hypothetical protein